MVGVTRKDPSPGHRDRLLAAAMTCLQHKGYARTTARDLVAASGTNLASIGYHFGGKEALLNAAVAECFRIWTARLEEAVFATAGSGPRERLERALTVMLGSFDELRPLIAACVEAFPAALHSEQLRRQLADAYADIRTTTAGMITRSCAELGLQPPGPPQTTASVLIALCDGLMLQWLLDPLAVPDASQAVGALSALSAVLTPPDE
ncbi:transcriptional regulator [Planobispora siamensis]|uniref:Transcriptional regulator n=1 Tax=Planobispora siamensis TaxID=936338 RepID=A0A8J3SPA7_9ACTN|nr:transcriptional regulator [Planobispora siamensis]